MKNWQSEVSPDEKNENLKSWQSEVSPDMWMKIGELVVKDKSRLKRKKTYLIGHLDCKTNQVGTQAGGDDLKR